jgi:hypothetical protein
MASTCTKNVFVDVKHLKVVTAKNFARILQVENVYSNRMVVLEYVLYCTQTQSVKLEGFSLREAALALHRRAALIALRLAFKAVSI